MAFNDIGQGYFIFAECDFDGALKDLLITIDNLQDAQQILMDNSNCEQSDLNKIDAIINKYLKVALYLERLKRGQNYE